MGRDFLQLVLVAVTIPRTTSPYLCAGGGGVQLKPYYLYITNISYMILKYEIPTDVAVPVVPLVAVSVKV